MKNSLTSYEKTIETEYEEQPIIKIAFLDVGQGDTSIISCPATNEAIVVDCVNADAVLDYLEEEHIAHLRGIIITHLHADHYNAVANLLNSTHMVPGMRECEVLAFNEVSKPKSFQKLSPDADRHSASYEQPLVGQKKLPPSSLGNLIDWCKQNKLSCAEIKVEKRNLPFQGTLAKNIQLVHPYLADYAELKAKGLNNSSVVLLVTGPGSSALLTGDLEPEGWKLLQGNYSSLHSDVLKFPHHGGAWNEFEANDLIKNVNPSTVVISVGTDNKYNHPDPRVFKVLSKYPYTRILCTQATNQCQLSAKDQRSSVFKQLNSQVSPDGYLFPASKSGCPCAGTIVIELGNQARVIQPKIKFHQESIIRPHFKTHKCSLEYLLEDKSVDAAHYSTDL